MTYQKVAKTVVAALTAVFLTMGSAYAEYHMTAFGGTRGYQPIIAGDVDSAVATFENRIKSRLDYFELGNLCVAQVLAKRINQAIATCESALEKLDSGSTSRTSGMVQRRKAAAIIYSNLGVARAMNGDLAGANDDLEQSLVFDPHRSKTRVNIEQVRSGLTSVAGRN